MAAMGLITFPQETIEAGDRSPASPLTGQFLPLCEITQTVRALYQHDGPEFPELRAGVIALALLLVSTDAVELAAYTGYPLAIVRAVAFRLHANGFLRDPQRLETILERRGGGALLMAWAAVGAGFSRYGHDGKFHLTNNGRRRVERLTKALQRASHERSNRAL